MHVRVLLSFFLRPVRLIQNYQVSNFRPDLIAGLTVGMIALPQAIAYAMIAELPPHSLYAAVVASIIGALWRSSHHLHTGPTNTISLLVLATLLPLAGVGSENFLLAAGLIAGMVGGIKLIFGITQLGVLVNFVPDSVVISFTTGAGVLIGFNQLRHLLRLDYPSTVSLVHTIRSISAHIAETHFPGPALGLGIFLIIVLLKRFAPKLPAALLAMVIATALVVLLKLDDEGVKVIGEIPRGLPQRESPMV